MRIHSVKLIQNIKIDQFDQQKDQIAIIKELREHTNDFIRLNGTHNSISRSSRKNSINTDNYNKNSRANSVQHIQQIQAESANIDVIVDQMLQKDYSLWNSKNYQYNALQSNIAKNSRIVQKYIDKVYVEYKIKNPLKLNFPQTTKKKLNVVTTPQKPDNNKKVTCDCLNPQLNGPDFKQKYNPKFNNRNNQYQSFKKNNGYKQFQYKQNCSLKKVTISYQTPKKELTRNQMIKFTQKQILSINKHLQKTCQSQQKNPKTSLINSQIKIFVPDQSNHLKNKLNKNSNISFHAIVQSYTPSINQGTQKDISQNAYGYENYPHVPRIIKNNRIQTKMNKNKQVNQTLNEVFQQKKLGNQLSKQQVLEQPISQTYRYCIGCEKPVLQANIPYHQKKCMSFIKIFSIQQNTHIISQVQNKIFTVTNKINNMLYTSREQLQQLENKQCKEQIIIDQTNNYIQHINQQVFQNKQSGSYQEQFIRTINNLKPSLMLAQQLSKLTWFVKIRLNLINQINRS